MEDESEQNIDTPMLPDVMSHLAQIDAFVKWDDDRPIPQEGLMKEYDQTVVEITEIEN